MLTNPPLLLPHQHQTRILRISILVSALATLAALAAVWLINDTERRLFTMGWLAGLLLIYLLSGALAQRYPSVISWLLALGQILFLTLIAPPDDLLNSPAGVAYLIPVLVAGLVLNANAALACAGLSVLALGGMALSHVESVSVWTIVIFILNGFSAGLLWLIIRTLEQLVAQTQAQAAQLQQARAELELRVLERTAQLQQTNEELAHSNHDLEQFAYVAAHDLQEPLRHLASYSQLLARRYQGQLDAEADEFISFIVSGAHRMRALITGLLEYSQVGRDEHALRPVDCTQALNEALSNLSEPLHKSGGVVTHDPLPIVQGNAIMLTQLFQNLIGNALKFRSARPPHIHIAAVQTAATSWRVSVRDNGIGIAPEYFERIFIIFQRLHARDEYPGAGIGLALCQKIVERHGGRIWVESTPETSTTFYFTLHSASHPDASAPPA